MTELGNLIMKSGSMAGEGIVNRSGNTKIKLDAAQSAADESKFAGEGAKSKLEALLQDYGIKKGIEDTAYNKKKDEQARIDRNNDKAEERAYRSRMLDITEGKAKAEQKEAKTGQKELDRKFAKEYNDYTSKDKTTYNNTIDTLANISKELKAAGDGVLAQGGGRWSAVPEFFQSDKALNWRDKAYVAINPTLKETFPGQLSNEERQASTNEIYNPRQSNTTNAASIDKYIEKLKNIQIDKENKAKFFENNGSLEGYKSDYSDKTNSSENKQSNSSYPKKVFNSKGLSATVSNAQEEAEAKSEGFN
jgi:hypothetical protein